MPRKSFVPPSARQQLAAIGLGSDGRTLLHKELYGNLPKRQAAELWDSLHSCIDPSGNGWEDIDHPEPNEWLGAMLDKTPDQSFSEYVASRPNRPDRIRNVIYLLPICEPTDLEAPPFPHGPWPSWSVLQDAAEAFYAPLIVRTLPAVPMHQLSPRPHSRMGSWGVEQWHAAMALDALTRHVPRDAYGLMAVTMCDLYPKPEWNFVYGLARLTQRVGIFSFVRHAPSGRGPEKWLGAQLLHRSLKTLLHEIGHMFGLKHCTWYNCLMRGSNGESVEHQTNHLYLCPVCLRKIHWCIGFDIRSRYAKLLEVYQEYESAHEAFAEECLFLRSRLEKLQSLPEGSTMTSDLQNMSSKSGESETTLLVAKTGSGRRVSSRGVHQRAQGATAVPKRRSVSLVRLPNATNQTDASECPCCQPPLQEARFHSGRHYDADKASKLLESLDASLSKVTLKPPMMRARPHSGGIDAARR
jgi:archaemetzincin